MFFKWKAFVVGGGIALVGWTIFHHALSPFFGAARPPTGSEMGLLALGAMVLLLGVFVAALPNTVSFLRLVYGDGFAPNVTCPVMVTCPSCYTYNVRARATCKACDGDLLRAEGAGSERKTLGHAADQREARERAEGLRGKSGV